MKAAWLAIPIALSAHAATGMTRHGSAPALPPHVAVRPAVVMFGLAIVRQHMLDTLVELIGKPTGRPLQRQTSGEAGLPPG